MELKFICIKGEVLKSKNLTAAEKIMLSLVLSFKKLFCKPEWLASNLGITELQADKTLKSLINKQIINGEWGDFWVNENYKDFL